MVNWIIMTRDDISVPIRVIITVTDPDIAVTTASQVYFASNVSEVFFALNNGDVYDKCQRKQEFPSGFAYINLLFKYPLKSRAECSIKRQRGMFSNPLFECEKPQDSGRVHGAA